jgi:hypothetical protein
LLARHGLGLLELGLRELGLRELGLGRTDGRTGGRPDEKC